MGGFLLKWESEFWDDKVILAAPYLSNKEVTIPPNQLCPSGPCQPIGGGVPSPPPSPRPPSPSPPSPPSPYPPNPPSPNPPQPPR